MKKRISTKTKIKGYKSGGLVGYNGYPIKPGSRSGNIGCGAIAPGKRKFTKIG
jgi:hypothetical protein